MKLKEFEEVQELIEKYHVLKTTIANVKTYLNDKDDKGNFCIYKISSDSRERISLTKEESNMILSRLESELLVLKSKIKDLGVEIENDK